MNKALTQLNKVKTLLGLNVSLESAKLDNGTVLEAESFEAGFDIFIVSEDEKVALPVGEYTMEDGKTLTVSEEGVIGEIKEAEASEVAPEVAPEVEASEEASKTPKKIVESTEVHFTKLDEFNTFKADILTRLDNIEKLTVNLSEVKEPEALEETTELSEVKEEATELVSHKPYKKEVVTKTPKTKKDRQSLIWETINNIK
jgi:hypothetical protein